MFWAVYEQATTLLLHAIVKDGAGIYEPVKPIVKKVTPFLNMMMSHAKSSKLKLGRLDPKQLQVL